MTLNTLLDSHTACESTNSEAEYLSRWQAATGNIDSPFLKAVAGGLQADRLAWVFIAGYQAAIRRCFDLPERDQLSQWLTFAVSEDGKPENPLPGVTWVQNDESLILNGYKTWIAASDHVSALIVKAGRGEQARYCLVDRDAPGLEITSKAKPSFLPDLSQGKACFKDVATRAMPLEDRKRFSQFAATEAFMTYTAFVACLWGQSQLALPKFSARSRELLLKAQDIYEHIDTLHPEALRDYDKGVQKLLADWLALPQQETTHWQRDKRLIQMYSKAIQTS